MCTLEAVHVSQCELHIQFLRLIKRYYGDRCHKPTGHGGAISGRPDMRMERSDWFAVLVSVFIFGAGSYLSTFAVEVIRTIGLSSMVCSAIGLILWFRFFHSKTPQLHCSFDMDDAGGCVCHDTLLRRPDRITNLRSASASSSPTALFSSFNPALEPPGTVSFTGAVYDNSMFTDVDRGTYYRIKVTAENGTIPSCNGKLISLKREKKLIAEPILLPFAPANNADALSKTVHENSSEHLDFLFISDSNHVELTPHGFQGPSAVRWQSLFDMPGDYSFDIQVLSPTAQDVITVLFHWTGTRETSKLRQMRS